MWSLSYTGQRSRFKEAQRVGVALDVGDISRQPETDPEEEVIMTDGALIEVSLIVCGPLVKAGP
jgi:hypothetical protein